MTLHIHEGISVASPNPPQTPPITLSLDDLLAFFKFSHVVINASDGFCCFPSEAVECVFLNYPSAGWPSIFLLPSTLIINTGKGIAFDQGVGSIRKQIRRTLRGSSKQRTTNTILIIHIISYVKLQGRKKTISLKLNFFDRHLPIDIF